MDRLRGSTGHNLIARLQSHVLEKPQSLAYRFLVDGEDNAVDITYAELDRRARRLAGHLQSLGLTDKRALLLHPQGIDYLVAFWACLYARVISIPLYPPSLKARSASRILRIAQDSECSAVLSTAQTLSARAAVFTQAPELKNLALVATDNLVDGAAPEWTPPGAVPETLAYLQYTSGSTSAPKGVMISHGNLLSNVEFMRQAYGVSHESVFVSWAPFFHDMGLIMGTLLPLCTGFPCVLMSPASFAQKPSRWLRAITRHGGTISFGSNFAFDLCVDSIPAEQRESFDLSGWRVAINGSEPVRVQTLERFAAAYRSHGFRKEALRPGYGLAESTLAVSCGRAADTQSFRTVRLSCLPLASGDVVETEDDAVSAQILVGCGTPNPEDRVIIVDPVRCTPCPPDRIGEIWVSGNSVALGYWNRPESTADTFGARLADSGNGPYLRTGDLGFLHDGEIFIAGRLKDLIITRGRNLYPQDIELTVESCHPGIRRGAGAAFSVDAEDEERLVIVQEIQRGQNTEGKAIAAAIRRAVAAEYEVQPHAVVLVRPGSIHKTSSGKIQRQACREAYLKGTLERYES